jgi:hypothetical protein
MLPFMLTFLNVTTCYESARLYRQQGVHQSEASEAQLDSDASEASEAPKALTALLYQRSHAGMIAHSSGR